MARNSGGSFIGNFFKHGIKIVISVAILSVFVLGIGYGVKQAYSTTPDKLANILAPYLSRVGIGEEQIGEVAGDFIKRVTDFGISSRSNTAGSSGNVDTGDSSSSSSQQGNNEPVAVVAIIGDSHVGNDKNEYIENKTFLAQALDSARRAGAIEVIHAGDITNFGGEQELLDAKEIMDDSGLDYVILPGDHDIAQTSDLSNFLSVFDTDNNSFELGGYKFVTFNNSTNYTLIPQEKISWLETQLADADFLILSQPLYTEGLVLLNCQYMGNSCSTPEDENLREKQRQVKSQRDEILALVRDSNVRAVIAGDHHRSSQTQDKDKPGLVHYVVGAVGGTFKEGYAQEDWQARRFSLMKLYENGAFTIEDVIL